MNNLVVAAAQSASLRGNLDENIAGHLRLIGAAASRGVNLIVFPELSLTGYELDLASSLQLKSDDPKLEPLRQAAKEHDMHVLVSAPWAAGLARPYLGAFLLSSGESTSYAKIHVHESEQPYFASGEAACVVSIRGVPTGLAICADTNQASHPAEAAERGAELYVASVMKTADKYEEHAEKLSGYAARHHMMALTANYAGSTGGKESAGKSAIWDENGRLLARAGSTGEALVVARRDDGHWHGEVVTDPD